MARIHLSTFEQMKTLRSDDMIVLDDQQLRDLQRVLLAVLDDIDSFCTEHSISYSLSGGSVLGALRHQGFIPWDDDADIFMFRKDYDRFAASFTEEYPSYTLKSPTTSPDNGLSIAQIRIKGTTATLYNDPPHDTDTGVAVDIFILENTFNNALARKIHGLACLGVGFIQSCKRFARDKDFYLSLDVNGQLASTIKTKAAIGTVFAFIPLRTWTSLTNKVYSLCSHDDSIFVSCPSGRKHYFGEMYLRSAMRPTRKETFEKRSFPVPADAEGYLETLHGSWRDVPPPEKRERHGYLAFDLGQARRSEI